MQYYSSVVDGELPDDLRLTIYYLSPSILTRVPLSSDQLISYSLTEKIIVESSELVKHQELLQKMNVSALQTDSEETYMNARLYYVFSTEDNEKLLEVVLSDRARDPFVNGIQVKDSNIVFELITPFLPEDVRNRLNQCIERTSVNTGMCLILALSYSSKWEITDAVKQIATKVKNGTLDAESITDETIDKHLCTNFMPDPDLLIRTGGEVRLSNYLLWQCAYSELYFCDTFWPDFKEEEFCKAICDYQRRERRFGKTSEQI
jgi:undecaprenyl diphosphate synthase